MKKTDRMFKAGEQTNFGKRDRRDELLSAAAKLFVEQGYRTSTMDDIATAVSLNKGTIYHYYESKAEILFDILVRINDAHLNSIRKLPEEGDILEIIKRYFLISVRYVIENRDHVQLNVQEAPFIDQWLSKSQARLIKDRYRQFHVSLKNLLERGIREGVFVDCDPTVVAQGVSGMLAFLPSWYDPKGAAGIDEVASYFSGIVLNGLVVRK